MNSLIERNLLQQISDWLLCKLYCFSTHPMSIFPQKEADLSGWERDCETAYQHAERVMTDYGNSILQLAYSYSEALADCLGFDVFQLEELPFEVEEITYTSYWNNMSEIIYRGNNQSAVFRQSLGSEDNSGDYTSYSVIKELTVDSRFL